MAPALFSRATGGASTVDTTPRLEITPVVNGMPARGKKYQTKRELIQSWRPTKQISALTFHSCGNRGSPNASLNGNWVWVDLCSKDQMLAQTLVVWRMWWLVAGVYPGGRRTLWPRVGLPVRAVGPPAPPLHRSPPRWACRPGPPPGGQRQTWMEEEKLIWPNSDFFLIKNALWIGCTKISQNVAPNIH